ncbi:S-adenosyl-L-methionine-dependent methyltransferase [Agrocybe pediades]|nr:S-adenosyl-L-methionine-dependent methyltransferase [Agrocybe pediades]
MTDIINLDIEKPAAVSTAKDFASANKEHFNKTASHHEDKRWVELARRAARAITERYKFDEDSTTVMDFACNTGLLARELAPHTKSIVGVDISQGAVDVFNERVLNQGIPPEEMRAVCVELKGVEGELDGQKFDVITCSVSYHHFEDINSITKMLSFFLKPGGTLFVVDISPPAKEGHHEESHHHHHHHYDHHHDGHSHGSSSDALFPEHVQHVVPHKHGLSREMIQAAFDGAALTSFTFEIISTVMLHGKEGQLFVATGTKSPA